MPEADDILAAVIEEGKADATEALVQWALYDGRVMRLPEPDLSGEWADGLTPDRLMRRIGIDPYTADPDLVNYYCDRYEDTFRTTVALRHEDIHAQVLKGEIP